MRRLSTCVVVLLASAALVHGPAVKAKVLKSGRFFYVTGSFDLPVDGGQQEEQVMCPDGTSFAGAGAALPAGVQGTLHYVGMTEGEGALVSVTSGADPKDKDLKVTAVCVDDLNVLSKFEFYTIPTGTSTAQAACAPDDVLIGGGGGDLSGHTAPHLNHPSTTSWKATTDNPGPAESGLIVARCISPGIVPVARESNFAVLDAGDSVKATCPKGTRVSAGGYELGPEIRASVPFDGKDKDRAPDDGWQVITAEDATPGEATVHAICVGNKPFD